MIIPTRELDFSTLRGTELAKTNFADRPIFKTYKGAMEIVTNPANTTILDLVISDAEFNDTYRIRLQPTNKGMSGMCFLNEKPSYQADFTSRTITLREVINNIAGGEVIAA